MTYKDYQEMKIGKSYSSVGMFGEHIYALMIMSGAAFCPDYYKISKTEFEGFPQNEAMLLKTPKTFLCAAHIGYTDFDENQYRD